MITRRGQAPVAVECKWSAREFDPAAMKMFRTIYPDRLSFVVAVDLSGSAPYSRAYGPLSVTFVSLADSIVHVTSAGKAF